MQGLSKQRALQSLRARIESIEKRPPLAAARRSGAPGTGFRLAAGQLHEIFADSGREAGAALGFALAAARRLQRRDRPAVLYLQLQHETAETGLPYGPGLVDFGLDPAALIVIRPADMAELLWAAEEALACRAVAAVIADVEGAPRALDFTASRRLGMRAEAGGGTLLLLRYGTARAASAARQRWHVAPAPSAAVPFDALAPGESRWRVRLEKGVWAGRPHGEWLLGWTKHGFELLEARDAGQPAGDAPVSGDVTAALADRLSQTA